MGRRCTKCGSPYVTHHEDISVGVSGNYYGYYEHKEWRQCRDCGHIEPVKPDKQPKEQHDRPPLMLSEEAIKEMDTWKGFGPHGPCPRCGSKYYNRANSKTDWWLCCDCGFSYKGSDK